MRVILMAVLVWCGLCAAALAEVRIALVIGNGAYTAVNGLPNPPNDAKLMADTLQKLGFNVTLIANGDLAGMSAAVATFGQSLRLAGPEATGLFYYAGHGVQSFGVNYLLPVDARLTNAADLGLVAIDAQSVLRQMASAHNRTNIVILDACRNNPFRAVRDLGDNGLAEMSAPTGTFLGYATAPGSVALDGTGGNSPFTKALADKIRTPGLPIEQAFKAVRVAVLDLTQGKQTPWDTSSLTNDFSFVAAGSGDEAALWASVNAARDPVQIMLFLRAYPDSAHDAEARALLATVMQTEVAAKPADPGKVALAVDPAELAAFEAAQKTGTLAAYQAFLTSNPASSFTEAVQAEIAALSAAPRAAVPSVDSVDAATTAAIGAEVVSFAAPLTVGPKDIMGRAIAELINLSPLYAPIAGLPKEAWANLPCSTCHKWTEAALCDQAKFYVKEAAPLVALTQHPLGGAFKLTLRQWGAGGCK